MKTDVISRAAILQVCRSIATEKGILALNMRTVAAECRIALGTLYNFYPDRDMLILDTVESIWYEILHMDRDCELTDSFPDAVLRLFARIQRGAIKYPDFLKLYSGYMASTKPNRAKSMMGYYSEHIKSGLLAALRADRSVDPAAFSASLTEGELIEFVLSNLLLLLEQGKRDCDLLIALICRALYR